MTDIKPVILHNKNQLDKKDLFHKEFIKFIKFYKKKSTRIEKTQIFS